jgi:hypothetical protein
MKRYYTGYASQRRSAYNTLCVVETLTLSLSRWLAYTRLGTKSWRPTEMAKSFLGYDIKHVRQEDNMAADTLSKLGSSRKAVPPGVFLKHLHVPSVKMVDLENPKLASSPVMAVLPSNPPWVEPYLEYLTTKKLPEDEVQKRQIERRAKAYTIIDGQLYKRSTSGVFMKCITQVDGIEILREIHEGECGHHAAARSLIAKAFHHGFY